MSAARVGLAAQVAIPSGIITAIAWNQEDFADAGTRDPAHPGRLIAPVAGFYHLDAEVVWQHAPGGSRRTVGILKNGIDYLAIHHVNPPGSFGQSHDHTRVTTLANFDVGDYVELVVFQDSGAAVNVVPLVGSDPTVFSLVSE